MAGGMRVARAAAAPVPAPSAADQSGCPPSGVNQLVRILRENASPALCRRSARAARSLPGATWFDQSMPARAAGVVAQQDGCCHGRRAAPSGTKVVEVGVRLRQREPAMKRARCWRGCRCRRATRRRRPAPGRRATRSASGRWPELGDSQSVLGTRPDDADPPSSPAGDHLTRLAHHRVAAVVAVSAKMRPFLHARDQGERVGEVGRHRLVADDGMPARETPSRCGVKWLGDDRHRRRFLSRPAAVSAASRRAISAKSA